MSPKPERPALGPGPRPRPRLSEEERSRVMSSVQDLGGFDRPMTSTPESPQEAVPEPAPEPEPPPVPVRPQPAPEPKAGRSARAVPQAEEWPDSIRFPVTSELYEELRAVAYKRRVTVRYLCLEALAKAGFKVDLENLPVDGRRTKKRK